MARKKTDTTLRGKCRHCGGAVIYWHPDEEIDTEYLGRKRRVDRPRWYHFNPDPTDPDAAVHIIQDSMHGTLGQYCPINKQNYVAGEKRQVAEPVEYCVELKGDWPRVFCLNPVQDTELFMCGVHAKKRRERMRATEARRETSEAREAHQWGAEEIKQRMQENWGLHVDIKYPWSFRGQVEVDIDELEGLLESLEEEYQRRKNA